MANGGWGNRTICSFCGYFYRAGLLSSIYAIEAFLKLDIVSSQFAVFSWDNQETEFEVTSHLFPIKTFVSIHTRMFSYPKLLFLEA